MHTTPTTHQIVSGLGAKLGGAIALGRRHLHRELPCRGRRCECAPPSSNSAATPSNQVLLVVLVVVVVVLLLLLLCGCTCAQVGWSAEAVWWGSAGRMRRPACGQRLLSCSAQFGQAVHEGVKRAQQQASRAGGHACKHAPHHTSRRCPAEHVGGGCEMCDTNQSMS